jgi:hypothetical protein
MLDLSAAEITEAELDELAARIEEVRKRER